MYVAAVTCHFVLLYAFKKTPTYCLRPHLLNTGILYSYALSCVGPADYLGGERRAIFEIGSNMATVEYSTVNDGIREGIESFIAELTVPPEMQAMGIVSGTPDSATVNIIDDEG